MKYKRDIDEIHKLFFEVSGDREKLIRLLEGKSGVERWSLLEDMALKDSPDTEAYRYVKTKKGEHEVERRKEFLEMQ
jgi:hypothetical protein